MSTAYLKLAKKEFFLMSARTGRRGSCWPVCWRLRCRDPREPPAASWLLLRSVTEVVSRRPPSSPVLGSMLCACFAPLVGCGRGLWVKFVMWQAILLSPPCLRQRGLATSSPSAVQVALGASALPSLWAAFPCSQPGHGCLLVCKALYKVVLLPLLGNRSRKRVMNCRSKDQMVLLTS